MRIVLLGPPGVGKGTQGMRLAHLTGAKHLATGDLVRAEIRAGTTLGHEIQRYNDRGELVPDEVVIGLIKPYLQTTESWILDGFPRDVAQARALDRILEEDGLRLDRVIALEAPDAALVDRALGRRQSAATGKTYHLTFDPPPSTDPGPFIRRTDDDPDDIRRRLQIYHTATEPLKHYYAERGLLTRVDASQSMDATTEAILRALGPAPAGAATFAAEGIKGAVRRQFGGVAEKYTTSAVHAGGPDLEALIAAVPSGSKQVLDVGCGTGHTTLAVAGRAASVIGVDLTEEMLVQARRQAAERGIKNVRFARGDAERLEYPDNTFDVVVSRYSAHHFPRPDHALNEIARILAPGGVFLLVDTVAPASPAQDTLLNAIEVLRDPSHVRDHTVDGWLEMFAAAGLQAEVLDRWPLRLAFDAWIARMQTPEVTVSAIAHLLDGAPQESHDAFAVEPDHSFTLTVALMRGRLSEGSAGAV